MRILLKHCKCLRACPFSVKRKLMKLFVSLSLASTGVTLESCGKDVIASTNHGNPPFCLLLESLYLATDADIHAVDYRPYFHMRQCCLSSSCINHVPRGGGNGDSSTTQETDEVETSKPLMPTSFAVFETLKAPFQDQSEVVAAPTIVTSSLSRGDKKMIFKDRNNSIGAVGTAQKITECGSTPAPPLSSSQNNSDYPEDSMSCKNGIEDTVGDDDMSKQMEPTASMDNMASALRARGKKLHDAGDFVHAADIFHKVSAYLKGGEDFATCCLHEALCLLKAGGEERAKNAVLACSCVLDQKSTLPNVIVARAFHRRAKAYIKLDEPDEALRDARSAAYLGDRKAVAFYGRLMRKTHVGVYSDDGTITPSLLPMEQPSLLDLLMSSRGNRSYPSLSAGSHSQFELPFMPSVMLNTEGSMMNKAENALGKSILSRLSKKLEEKATQDSICDFLQRVSALQIQSFARMTGFTLAENHANQLTRFCKSISPQKLQKWIRFGQFFSSGVRLFQKLLQVVSKYRSVLIIVGLMAWAKSAMLYPLPISKSSGKYVKVPTQAEC